MDPDLRRVQERDREKKFILKGPRYYDYPDGQDLIGKLSYTIRMAIMFTLPFGAFNSIVPPIPKTVPGKCLRVAKIVVPAVGMAATFTIVTYYSTVIRKKDDILNYVIGGGAAGIILRPAIGMSNLIYWGPFYCGALGAFKKYYQLQGQPLIGKTERTTLSPYLARKLDTSLEPEGHGNWIKSK